MRISRENYEAWFLDYIEGKLNSSETEILLNFLTVNPDLKAELENYETVSVAPVYSIFPNKGILKKNVGDITTVTDLNFDELCIAQIEGTLDAKKESLLFAYLNQHPERNKEFNAYKKAVLKPDLNIVFDSKRKLKHLRLNSRMIIRAAVSVAATLLFLLMVYNYYSKDEVKKNTASINTENIEKPKKLVPGKIDKINAPRNVVSKNSATLNNNSKKKSIAPAKKDIQDIERIEIEMAFMQIKDINSIENYCSSEIIKAQQPYLENLATAMAEQNEINRKTKFDLWTLAKLGANGINNITGLNIILVKTEDNRHQVAIEAGLISFYSSSDKK